MATAGSGAVAAIPVVCVLSDFAGETPKSASNCDSLRGDALTDSQPLPEEVTEEFDDMMRQ